MKFVLVGEFFDPYSFELELNHRCKEEMLPNYELVNIKYQTRTGSDGSCYYSALLVFKKHKH